MWHLCDYIYPTKMPHVMQKTLSYIPNGRHSATSLALIYYIDIDMRVVNLL